MSTLLRQLAVLNPSTPEPACLGFRAEQAQSKAEAAPEERQSEALPACYSLCVGAGSTADNFTLRARERASVCVCVCAHECGGQRVFTEELSTSFETRPSKSGLGVVEHYFRYVKLCYICLCCELFT